MLSVGTGNSGDFINCVVEFTHDFRVGGFVIQDVYKRQVSLPAKVKLLGQILSAAVLVIFFDVNIDWIDLPYVGIIESVSYTHLDVYKRQS